MSAKRKEKPVKHKVRSARKARIEVVEDGNTHKAVPSPAKLLQARLDSHFQPLSKTMAVILVSLLAAFVVMTGWHGGAEMPAVL